MTWFNTGGCLETKYKAGRRAVQRRSRVCSLIGWTLEFCRLLWQVDSSLRILKLLYFKDFRVSITGSIPCEDLRVSQVSLPLAWVDGLDWHLSGAVAPKLLERNPVSSKLSIFRACRASLQEYHHQILPHPLQLALSKQEEAPQHSRARLFNHPCFFLRFLRAALSLPAQAQTGCSSPNEELYLRKSTCLRKKKTFSTSMAFHKIWSWMFTRLACLLFL